MSTFQFTPPSGGEDFGRGVCGFFESDMEYESYKYVTPWAHEAMRCEKVAQGEEKKTPFLR